MSYATTQRQMDIFRGDIFYIEMTTSYPGSDKKPNRPGIVVSNDNANKYSPNVEIVFLTSQEKKPLPTHVEVVCKVPSIALCENIQTVSKDRLSDFVKSCTKCEMEEIDKALLVSLGVTEPSPVAIGGGLRKPCRQFRETPKSKGISTRACTNSFWTRLPLVYE